MAGERTFQAIKGTRDLLPPETELWNRVEQTAREVFGTFGFGEIRLPIFEPTELFARSIGLDTDVVAKEMYTFVDRPEKLTEPKTIGDYGRFIDDVIKLLRNGEIPRTAGNERAILKLHDAWKRFSSLPPKELLPPAEVENVHELVFTKDALQLGPEVSLRPEATASVCRAYIEHGMQALAQPVKLYYTGPMFRRERPQKGRYRQFYQIGAEVLEAITPNTDATKSLGKDAAVDAEVIEMVMAFFGRLGLEGVQLDINSIGHSAPECRRGYVEKLKAALENVKGRLGADSQRRIETNPLRVLDSKLESEQEIIAGLPRIGDHLCADCAKHYAEVKRQLELRGVKYRENWRLVRGLDYYMRTTFEITARGLGSQNAVCGGGRYDGLVELLGGAPTKGIGFAIGEDRLILSLQEARREVASGEWLVASRCDVYVAWMGKTAEATAIRAARDLRGAGFRVELPPVEQKFGKALGQADKLGARYALILGEDEVASGEWTVKTLADGTQGKVREERLVEFLNRGKEKK
jgi:histidyl-tRNA synthetase